MMKKDAESLLRETKAILEGHFLLTSGLHSPLYVEKFNVLQHPEYTEKLCEMIADHFRNQGVQTVIGPATGGIILSQVTARLLGTRSIFTERENGKMTLHIVMPSQNIVNLFLGTAEDAQKDGAKLIQPTTEEVTYSDGSKEEVYAFDVPVEALEKEFDLALIGTKGKWYDHKVSVSNPVKAEE